MTSFAGLLLGIAPAWGVPARAGAASSNASVGTLGNTRQGGASAWLIAGRKRVDQYQLPASARLSKLSVYLSPSLTAHVSARQRRRHAQQLLRGVVYSDANGRPGALLATSVPLKFTSTDPPRWYDLTFPAPLHLPAGRYWIGVRVGAGAGVVAYRYDKSSRRISLYASYVADGPSGPAVLTSAMAIATPVGAPAQSPKTPEEHPSPPSPVVPVNSGLPVVSGVAEVGQVLSAGVGVWSGSPSSYGFQWLRCDSSGGGCAAIGLATSSGYTVVSGDVGHTLRVQVVASNEAGSSTPADSAQTGVVPGAGVQHLEYVFEDGLVSVYDMDHEYKRVGTINLPPANAQTFASVRGVTVAPSTHMLFVSYGGDGGAYGNGSVLAYDLVKNEVVWNVKLETGIDSGQVSPDGTKLYMPTGENTPSGIWNIINTTNGSVIGTIKGGAAAHNTVVSSDGRYVYLGGHDYNYLDAYDTTTGKVVKEIGPLQAGVRPFTVNGSNTLSFTTATNFDGFQVSSITTGKVLFTVSFGSVPPGFVFTGPSHGISLSPDEKQLYVIDSVNKEVRVYDVSEVSKGVAPSLLGTVPVAGLRGEESACAYDCGRGGWLQRSIDGRFVFVGDSGEVIETATRKVIATLPALLNTKKSLEIDWENGVPIATSNRTGVGGVG